MALRMPAQTIGRSFGLFLLTSLFLPSTALAGMALSNAIVHFEPGQPARQDVEISNVGDEPLYVQVEPKAVLNPGSDKEERRNITDPREYGLLVTPNRLVIPPGTARVMRLVNLGLGDAATPDQERIFRITARPVAGEFEAKTSGLKVLIGYEVLAIVYPNKPTPTLEVDRSGRQLSVRNTGNTNVFLQEGFQCETPGAAEDSCTSIPGRRLYPGNEWQLTLPHDLPVKFYQSVGTRNFVETYP